jgi:hypothetical protein
MAAIRNFRAELRWRGVHSGAWVIFDLDLDDVEVAGAEAALAVAIAAVLVECPPPINVVVAAMIVQHVNNLRRAAGPRGVSVHVEGTGAAMVPAVDLSNYQGRN